MAEKALEPLQRPSAECRGDETQIGPALPAELCGGLGTVSENDVWRLRGRQIFFASAAYRSTFLAAFSSHNSNRLPPQSVKVDDCTVKLQIHDTAGQERFRAIVNRNARRCTGALVVFDVTDETSFQHAKSWVDLVKDSAQPAHGQVQILLLANKCDLVDLRKVSSERGQQLADQLGVHYMETSSALAPPHSNVVDVFSRLTRLVLAQGNYRLQGDESVRRRSCHSQCSQVKRLDLNMKSSSRRKCCT
eukprot:CAMPEP_0175844692 /NCGR_PEP_ID=MMETSP0107_2-20121207/21786_1 /TAXON_ID=195067 ORGANISM="Goniomonas pacifica, Strain CCMP1869" /NCGR_SAMPLE_ID=MMETSP0107_2 /ASSEMBLY_ACC=CAM_ASM_000203 /LENGTH=247 /DNA_ID=CAMNT_0017159119 /DNA_START=1 /DNA_END=745 /DNA_ORIENTATION=+